MKIDQNGSESAELSANGSFIVVRVPVQAMGEAPRGGNTVRYVIGSFAGREAKLLTRTGALTNLTFRIPKELFRTRQRLTLEVLEREEDGSVKVLWARRYEAAWLGSVPRLEPVVDFLGQAPEDKG